MKLALVFQLFVSVSWGSEILYLALTASPSHTIWDKTLALALAKNHQITFVSHGPVKSQENFTSLEFEGVLQKLHEDYVMEELFDTGPKGQIDLIFEWMHGQSVLDSKTQGLQELIKLIDSGKKFDIIIMDITTGHFMYPIIEKLGSPPLVLTSAFGINIINSFHFGNNYHTSYIPLWMMTYSDNMTFYQRIENLIYTVYCLYVRQYRYMPAEFELAKQVFGDNITSFDVLDKHASLLLANNDPVLDYPQSLPPSIIHVGGLHVKRVTELPKDLKKILDDAKNGAILFSLGTNVRSDSLKRERREALIKALGKLKQIVIWKFESEIENLPKNIIVRKWLPQNEILAHPNLKLFISHGGALSIQEAMYHGVPVVGLPFFADQLSNMYKVVNKKIGLGLVYGHLTEKNVYDTVSEVLNNPIYKNNIQLISKRYRDQPQNALDRAVFWVEYALRNNGAQHLRIAARDMSIVQIYFLDFLALIVAILATTIYITCKFVKSKCHHNEKLKKQ